MADFWQWKGDLPTGSGFVMLKDGAGRQGMNTVFGDAITAERQTQINVQFQYNISTYDVTTTTIDTGTVTQSSHNGIVSTGGGISGSATLQSIDNLRYIPGHEGYALFTTQFDIPDANVDQKIGIYDGDDGFYLGFIGLNFAVVRRRDGVDHITYQQDFNLNKLDGSGAEWTAVNFTNGNIWRITYGWLGYATINFEVMEQDGSWTTFHKIEYPNNNTETNIGNPVLPMRMEVSKTGGILTANITMKTGSWNAGIIDGASACCNRYFAFDSAYVVTAINTLFNIFTIKSMTAFQTYTNKVRTVLEYIGIAHESKNVATIRLIRNANFVTITANYTSIDTGNSTVQYTTVHSVISGGKTSFTSVLSPNTSDRLTSIEDLFLHINPGETFTFAAQLADATNIAISTRWKEEF